MAQSAMNKKTQTTIQQVAIVLSKVSDPDVMHALLSQVVSANTRPAMIGRYVIRDMLNSNISSDQLTRAFAMVSK